MPELTAQAAAFIGQLTPGDRDLLYASGRPEFTAIEPVTAAMCFLPDHGQIVRYRLKRLPVFTETDQLRMTLITPGLAAKDFFCQQSFTP